MEVFSNDHQGMIGTSLQCRICKLCSISDVKDGICSECKKNETKLEVQEEEL